jgi:hypothetical protein
MQLIYLTGCEAIAVDEIVLVQFDMLRIPGVITRPEDVDTAKLQYSVELQHFSCITPHAFLRMITPASNGTLFHQSVYFHPNVREDGWDEIVGIHQKVRGEYDSLPNNVDKGKNKKMGKKKNKVISNVKVSFPNLPLRPRFWQHSVRGSAINLWPPNFFNDWVNLVANGHELRLEPRHTQTAKPISQPSPPVAGPSHHPSALTQELPSPPRGSLSEDGVDDIVTGLDDMIDFSHCDE